MPRPGLSDEEFAILEPFLPEERPKKAGRPWRPHRIILDAIFWILRTGSPWRDLPERYGPWQTVYARFTRWRKDGTWKRIFEALQAKGNRKGGIVWDFGALDGSVVRAHKAAAGANRNEGNEVLTPAESQKKQALGESRGGLSTKIHIVVEGEGKPLAVRISPGQEHETKQAIPLVDDINVGGKQGRPRKRLDTIAGDKGYDSKAIRNELKRRGTTPVIAHRRNKYGEYPSSAEGFDKEKYRGRNVVERTIGHIKELRRIATRYEKLSAQYMAMLHLAFIRLWLNFELLTSS